MRTNVDISPKILEWVLSQVRNRTTNDVIETIQIWIKGEKPPTFNQVEKISKATGVPLGYFFLKTPPVEDKSLIEFRTIDSVDLENPSRNLMDTIDLVTYRLDKMESVKVEELEREPHPEYELFNTEEYRKQVFSMFGGESQNVTLLFTANILSDMFDRFGDDIRIKKADEETYSVDVC